MILKFLIVIFAMSAIAVAVLAAIMAPIKRRAHPRVPAEEINDRNRMAVARKAIETGKSCLGTVDEEGNLTIQVLEPNEKGQS